MKHDNETRTRGLVIEEKTHTIGRRILRDETDETSAIIVTFFKDLKRYRETTCHAKVEVKTGEDTFEQITKTDDHTDFYGFFTSPAEPLDTLNRWRYGKFASDAFRISLNLTVEDFYGIPIPPSSEYNASWTGEWYIPVPDGWHNVTDIAQLDALQTWVDEPDWTKRLMIRPPSYFSSEKRDIILWASDNGMTNDRSVAHMEHVLRSISRQGINPSGEGDDWIDKRMENFLRVF